MTAVLLMLLPKGTEGLWPLFCCSYWLKRTKWLWQLYCCSFYLKDQRGYDSCAAVPFTWRISWVMTTVLLFLIYKGIEGYDSYAAVPITWRNRAVMTAVLLFLLPEGTGELRQLCCCSQSQWWPLDHRQCWHYLGLATRRIPGIRERKWPTVLSIFIL